MMVFETDMSGSIQIPNDDGDKPLSSFNNNDNSIMNDNEIKYLPTQEWTWDNYLEQGQLLIDKNERHFDIMTFHKLDIPQHIIHKRKIECKDEDGDLDKKKWLKRIDAIVSTEYEMKKAYFEKYYFKVINDDRFLTIDKDTNTIVRFTKSSLVNMFENLHLKTIVKSKLDDGYFIKEWLRDRNLKTYRKLDFVPPTYVNYVSILHTKENVVNKHDVYNLYMGFAIDEQYKEYIEAGYEYCEERFLQGNIYKHLFHLVGKRDDCLIFLMKWLAHLFQYRSELPRTAIIFKSDEGCGKQFLVNLLSMMIGEKFITTSADIQTWTEKHSNARVCKFLSVLEETNGMDTYKNIDKLKNYITDTNSYYNPKGKDMVDFKNYCRWIFNTNNDCPVKISPTDRRFVIFDCWTDYLYWDDEVKTDYFSTIYSLLHNVECFDNEIIDFYTYLMSLDVGGYDFSSHRPQTESYKITKEASIPIHIRFVDSMIMNILNENYKDFENCYNCISCYDNEKKLYTTQASRLYQLFTMYKNANGYIKFEMTSTKFGRVMKTLTGITKHRTSKYNEYKIDLEDLQAYMMKKYDFHYDFDDLE